MREDMNHKPNINLEVEREVGGSEERSPSLRVTNVISG